MTLGGGGKKQKKKSNKRESKIKLGKIKSPKNAKNKTKHKRETGTIQNHDHELIQFNRCDTNPNSPFPHPPFKSFTAKRKKGNFYEQENLNGKAGLICWEKGGRGGGNREIERKEKKKGNTTNGWDC